MANKYRLPANASRSIQALIRHYGQHGDEVAILLAGAPGKDGVVVLDRIIIPRQKAFQTAFGCGLLIDGACLNRVGPTIRQQGRRIHGILHSHPNEAYHSDTDEAGVLMRFSGAFSIVIPRFSAHEDLLHAARAYIFDHELDWIDTPIYQLIAIDGEQTVEVLRDE